MLSSMIQYPSGPVEDLETNSISGPTSMIGYTHRTDMESSRVDLNWNAGTDGWRTYTQDAIDGIETDDTIPNQLKSVFQRGASDGTLNSGTYTIRLRGCPCVNTMTGRITIERETCVQSMLSG